VDLIEALAAARSAVVEVAPDVDPVQLDPRADLRAAADLDSLDFLRVVEELRRLTGVDVPEADYDRVRSLTGMAGYVVERAGADRG